MSIVTAHVDRSYQRTSMLDGGAFVLALLDLVADQTELERLINEQREDDEATGVQPDGFHTNTGDRSR